MCAFWYKPTKFGTGTPYNKLRDIFGGGQKLLFIGGLICINSTWSSYNLSIITLSIVNLEQMKRDK